METQKVIKKYQQQIREGQTKLEEEQRAKEVARDALVGAERKAHAMQNGLEEARTLLEQADKNRRATEVELSDVNEQLSDATVQNQSIAAAKRKLESEMQTLHVSIILFSLCLLLSSQEHYLWGLFIFLIFVI